MSHVKRLLIFILTVIYIPLASGAGEKPPVKTSCAEATTTIAMRACLNQHYTQVDGKLNEVYQQLMAQLNQTRQTKLREAQRSWIQFRDKQAEFAASAVEGGSMYPLVYLSALASMTEKRVNDLKAILQNITLQKKG